MNYLDRNEFNFEPSQKVVDDNFIFIFTQFNFFSEKFLFSSFYFNNYCYSSNYIYSF